MDNAVPKFKANINLAKVLFYSQIGPKIELESKNQNFSETKMDIENLKKGSLRKSIEVSSLEF